MTADYVRETVGRTPGLVDLDQVPELSGHERRTPSGAWRPLATAVWPSRSGSVDDRFQRSLPDESIGFTAVAKAGELLADTGIDAIVALNVDESERWLLLGSIDELARQAENPGRSWIRRHSARIAASKRPTRRSRE
ncbi:MAG TPA: hypothetical protein VF908_03575 [Gemmatimonadaceae bacterium]